MSENGIAIESIRAGTGSVIASFDCQLGGVRIVGARLVQGRNGGRFLGLPSRRPPDPEQWVEIVVLSDALRGRVLATAEEALRVVQLQQVDASPEVPF